MTGCVRPTPGYCLVLGVAVLLSACAARDTFAQSARQEPTGGVATQRALLDRYCVTCHTERNKANAGHLALDSADLASVPAHAATWEKVIAKVRAGLMPPSGRPRPEPAALSGLVTFLETGLDRAALGAPNPGRTEAFHRINRAEYQNSVRDLLNLDIDVTEFLPSDDASYGFDNIAGVLKISQSRLEQYLAAARRISRAAVSRPPASPLAQEYRVPETALQYDHVDGLPFGTRGGMVVRHHFPRDGEYEFQVLLMCRRGGECDGSAGFADEHTLIVLVDGVDVKTFTLEPRREFRPADERIWRVRVPVKSGPHEVGVTFRKLPSIREIDSAYQRFLRPYYLTGIIGQPNHTIYQPFLDAVTIVGPFQPGGVGETPSRQGVFVCHPNTAADEEPCARTILRTLARRAYRHPVTAAELEPLQAIYRERSRVDGFEAGIEAALQRLLVSFEFLYRVERDPAGAAPASNYAISDLELASRLSFFLWSSGPDDALLRLAEQGRLRSGQVLGQQVRRMLQDPRADALVENFAGQWLMLRNLEAVRPDVPLFPNFDDTLRDAARRETEMLFASVLREHRSALDLLTADYTFVNERLARHYGMRGIYGNGFRRVAVPDERRRGLLGHASILTVTSRPNRTSPVLRGKWILENVLGTPPPEPPADVPSLEENPVSNHLKLSVRERLAKHRANAVCAGCHSMIDPPGFALENFDAVGQWRNIDEASAPIDPTGTLPDGAKFAGVVEFRARLLRSPDVFVTTVTRKLMTYALGRGLEAYDMPAVRRIVKDAAAGGYTLSDLVLGVARSVPFQMRRTGDAK